MTTPEQHPTAAAAAVQMSNAHRIALVAIATVVLAFLIGLMQLTDASGADCGSAISPEGDQFDEQTFGCTLRVTAQQAFVYPIMLLGAAVTAGALSWHSRE